jgi:hypothetical protein
MRAGLGISGRKVVRQSPSHATSTSPLRYRRAFRPYPSFRHPAHVTSDCESQIKKPKPDMQLHEGGSPPGGRWAGGRWSAPGRALGRRALGRRALGRLGKTPAGYRVFILPTGSSRRSGARYA